MDRVYSAINNYGYILHTCINYDRGFKNNNLK